MIYLTNTQKNKTRCPNKEVSKMIKKTGALIAVISLFLGQSLTFAADTVDISTKLLEKTSIEVTYLNSFGISLNSTRDISSTIQTIRKEPGKKDLQLTTTTKQTVKSSWRASGLKIDDVTGYSIGLENGQTPENAKNREDFSTDYKNAYDENGKLAYAREIIGTSDSTETDDSGDVSKSHTKNTYQIHDAEANVSQSSTDSYTYSKGDLTKEISRTHTDGNNNYAEIGGAWVNTSSSSHSVTTGSGQKTGTKSDTIRTTTYDRDPTNGLLRGLTVGMTGSRTVENGQGGYITENIFNGPVTDTQKIITSFEVMKDDKQGYYVGKQTVVWIH